MLSKRMIPQLLISALSISIALTAVADDSESRGERTAIARQLDPFNLPGWHGLKPVPQFPSGESADALLKRVERLNGKLDAITIPKIEFVNRPLREVLSWLRDETTRLDAEDCESNKGINILIRFSEINPTVLPAVSLRLNSVTVREALQQLAAPLKAQVEVFPYGVALRRD